MSRNDDVIKCNLPVYGYVYKMNVCNELFNVNYRTMEYFRVAKFSRFCLKNMINIRGF